MQGVAVGDAVTVLVAVEEVHSSSVSVEVGQTVVVEAVVGVEVTVEVEVAVEVVVEVAVDVVVEVGVDVGVRGVGGVVVEVGGVESASMSAETESGVGCAPSFSLS